MLKRFLSMRKVAAIVACLAAMSVPFSVSGQVCSIGSTNYNTVEDAISHVPTGGSSATTITMLQDYQVNNGTYINNKKIVFNLNGHNLTFYNNTNNNNGRALDLDNGSSINYSGTGKFSTNSTNGLSLKVYGSSATVMQVTTSNSGYAIEASNEGYVTVNGGLDGNNAVTNTNGGGINAHNGGYVTIYGKVSSGTLQSLHAGVDGSGSKHSTIDVWGDVKSSAGIGAETDNSGIITVVGTISANTYYAHCGGQYKTWSQYTTPSTKAGYLMYTDGNSYVFVAAADASIGTRNYLTVQDAINAVPAGLATPTTVTLQRSVTYTTGLTVTNYRNISFNTNIFTLTVGATSSTNAFTFSLGAKFTSTGSGSIVMNSGYEGIQANDGSTTVNITGSISGVTRGIVAETGSNVTFTGSVSSTSATLIANNTGSAILLNGNVTAGVSGPQALAGGNVTVNGTISTTGTYLLIGTVPKAKTDFVLPSTKTGYATYSDGTNTVWVKGTAPTITGGTPSITVLPGYTAMSTASFTISGDPAPRVTKTSGDSHLTWNDATKKIDIAPGLTTGSYSAVLSAQNGVTPNGSYIFTFIVGAPPICQIGSINYTALNDAIAAVPTGSTTTTTIKLLADINYVSQQDYDYGIVSLPSISITNKKIVFDLNGFNLSIKNYCTYGIYQSGGYIDFTGTGTFNVQGGYDPYFAITGGAGVYVTNSGSCRVSSVTIAQAYQSGGTGVVTNGSGCIVTVEGNIDASDYDDQYGVGATGVLVTTGSIVTVKGNIIAGQEGVIANGGTATVKGNISQTGYGSGAYAQNGGKVTVDGKITSNPYIQTGTVVKTATDFTLPSDLAGYAKYTDGTNKVYVKGTAPTFTGTSTWSDFLGYTDFSVSGFTTTGDPSPRISKTSGNALITWNDATQTIDVAAGLAAGSYPVVLTAANGITPDATLTFTLTITNTSAVETITADALTIYPNPVKNELFIMNNEQLTMNNVEIVDLSGKTLMSQSSPLSQINVTNLSAGVYFIKITTDKGIVTKKFVKK